MVDFKHPSSSLQLSSQRALDTGNALLFTPGLTFSSVHPAWFEVAVFLAATDENNPIPAPKKSFMKKILYKHIRVIRANSVIIHHCIITTS